MNQTLDWPRLAQLRMADNEPEVRRRFVGGSDANIILSGNPERVLDLWLEKRGDRVPADLSTHLPVALGCWTEAFNRQWFEALTGRRVGRCGEIRVCRMHS